MDVRLAIDGAGIGLRSRFFAPGNQQASLDEAAHRAAMAVVPGMAGSAAEAETTAARESIVSRLPEPVAKARTTKHNAGAN